MDFWYAITFLGTLEFWAAVSLLLTGAYLILRGTNSPHAKKLRDFLIILIPTMVATFLIVFSLKAAFAIPRPCAPCPAEPCNPLCVEDFSFPSGHSAAMFAAFAATYIAYRKERKYWPLLAVVPVLVAISRVMLGVHTYVDIVAGSAIGTIVPFLVYRLLRKERLVKSLKL